MQSRSTRFLKWPRDTATFENSSFTARAAPRGGMQGGAESHTAHMNETAVALVGKKRLRMGAPGLQRCLLSMRAGRPPAIGDVEDSMRTIPHMAT